MKRKILLLMMTALLSVGAWAENLWSGNAAITWSSGVFKLETASKGLSSGDVLIFTISDKTTDDGLSICEHNSGNPYWAGNELEKISTQVGTIKMVVTDAIATAAGTELWVAGNGFTITSVDLERKTCVNVYTNESGYEMNYWYMLLDSQKLKYAKVGDHLRVTISAVGENTGWRKLYIQDKAEQAHDANYTGNILYTCEGASLTTGKLDIWLTNDMITLIQANSLYIGGFEYTFTAVDLYHAPIELANDADNTTTISDWKNILTDVTLAGRTLTKDGNWNTLCLPFAVSAEQLAESTNPLYGATIKQLATTSSLDSEGTLTLNFTAATEIEAGMPYIVKWASGENVSNPLFEGVTITATTPTAVEFTNNASVGNCKFVGQFSPFPINAYNIDEIIMLGSGNRLGYSQDARELNTFRAHFEVPTTSGGNAARGFVMNFGGEETTGIISVQGSGSMVNGSDAWYSLGGQRLQGAPTAKGVYIQNGRKVVVK